MEGESHFLLPHLILPISPPIAQSKPPQVCQDTMNGLLPSGVGHGCIGLWARSHSPRSAGGGQKQPGKKPEKSSSLGPA